MIFYIFTLFRILWFKYYTTAKFQNVDDIFTQCCFLKVLNSYNHRSIFFSLTVHRGFLLFEYKYSNTQWLYLHQRFKKKSNKISTLPLSRSYIFHYGCRISAPVSVYIWLNTLFQLLIWCKDTIIDVSRTNSWHVCEGFSSDDWCIIISNTHSLP